MNQTSICELVRKAEQDFTKGKVKVGKYVNWSMHDTLETITAYLNSRHTSGDRDSLGREKPFFNICSAAANIWYRATDIDRKDIRLIPKNSKQVVLAFVGQVILQDWMIRERFGVFLNLWGRALSRYGSADVKFVEQNGRLIPSVVPWNRLIVDPISFDALPTIEKLYFTPEQLRKNSAYNQEMVDKLIDGVIARKNLDGESVDLKSNFIEVYEVHGELPVALLKENPTDDDWKSYRQQMHVVTFLEVGDKDSGDYSEYTLYKGKEKKNPNMITHLIEEDGRTLSIGAVEYLFDAQWMQNHTIKAQRDYLDLASKLVFQTSDSHFLGRNVLSAIETGDILIHAQNQPLTQVNNTVMNMQALTAFSNQWLVLAKEITSTPDAVRGNTMPSGTPYSLGVILQQQAGSLFEIMTESKGLHIEDMLREYVIPFIKKQMDTSEEIGAILDDNNIAQIDAMYVPQEAIKRYNKKAIDEFIVNDTIPSPYQKDIAEMEVKQELAPLGNQRFFKPSEILTMTWAKLLKDFEWKVKVEVTNEDSDKQAILQSLNTVYQTIVNATKNPNDPNAKLVFSEILNRTGTISPLQLSTTASAPVPTQPVESLPA